MNSPQVIAALGALAHDARLAAYRVLVETGPDGMPAGMLAERLHLPPSSLSFHLQALLHAGLVSQRRLGRQVLYAMVPGAVNELVAYLTENCCGQAFPPANRSAAIPACVPAANRPATKERAS